MALTLQQEGTWTSASANEERIGTAITASLPKTIVFVIDTSAMVNGDIFEFRVFSGVLSTDTAIGTGEVVHNVTYANQQGNGNEALNATSATGSVRKDSPPIVIIGRGDLTGKRISATNRAFDFAVYFLD